MPVAAPYEVTATMRFGRHPVRATVVASPRRWLPARTPWDLPELIRLIDNARDRVRVQLLSLHLRDKAGRDIARLQNALRRAGGNRSEAARLLGLHRTTLWRKLKEWGME